MKKPHLNIGTIGYVDHGKSTLAAAVYKIINEVELAPKIPELISISSRTDRPIYVKHIALTEKQNKVIKAMQNGCYIESTNGCHRCDGHHLTKQSMKTLRGYGLIERKQFVGNFSTISQLTEKGKNYNLEL